MSGLITKREQIVKQLRQKNREMIREGMRNIAFNKLCGHEPPLISSVLQMFWDLSHFQLIQNRQKIVQVLEYTNFQELTDQQHSQIVTDLFYLIHQQILICPVSLRFKKNQNLYTASLVAYLSADIEPDQLSYWIHFMSDQDKKITISMVEGQEFAQSKWATNKKLFIFLLQQLRWCCQASVVFKSMLLTCDDLTKKQVDQSVGYIVKAIDYSHKEQNQQLRISLLSTLMSIMEIYFKIKEKRNKVMEMSNLLKRQLVHNFDIFLNDEILSDLNRLYQQQPDNYLQDQTLCPFILLYVSNKIQTIDKKNLQLYLNGLFRLCYNNWLVRQLFDRSYRYTMQFYKLMDKVKDTIQGNVWYLKLWRVIQ